MTENTDSSMQGYACRCGACEARFKTVEGFKEHKCSLKEAYTNLITGKERHANNVKRIRNGSIAISN